MLLLRKRTYAVSSSVSSWKRCCIIWAYYQATRLNLSPRAKRIPDVWHVCIINCILLRTGWFVPVLVFVSPSKKKRLWSVRSIAYVYRKKILRTYIFVRWSKIWSFFFFFSKLVTIFNLISFENQAITAYQTMADEEGGERGEQQNQFWGLERPKRQLSAVSDIYFHHFLFFSPKH